MRLAAWNRSNIHLAHRLNTLERLPTMVGRRFRLTEGVLQLSNYIERYLSCPLRKTLERLNTW